MKLQGLPKGFPAMLLALFVMNSLAYGQWSTSGNNIYTDPISGDVGIGTATIPHGSVGIAKLAIEGTNANAAGPHVQFTTASDNYPLIQILPWTHDNINIFFDAYYDGINKSSDAGSSFLITKGADAFRIRYDVAAAGGAITWNEGIALTNAGNVGIGTANPGTYKLAVVGKIRAFEVVVETGWSDFVFADDYPLMPLPEVEAYIQAHKHLPDIPSEKEVAENGVSLGQTQALLLQKVEELTLYMIDLKKENEALKARVAELER